MVSDGRVARLLVISVRSEISGRYPAGEDRATRRGGRHDQCYQVKSVDPRYHWVYRWFPLALPFRINRQVGFFTF